MDIDELVNEWRRFSLMEEEKEGFFTLETDEIKEIEGQLEHNLVGKLLSNRFISKMAIKNAMMGAWKTRGDFNVEILSKNIFSFKFENTEDKKWILNNGPWLFDKSLLVLESPTTSYRVTDMEFKKVDLWLRIINLPMGFRNELIARKIGDKLGTFLEWDKDKSNNSWGNSIRVRVKIDISKPLRRGFMFKIKESSEECWISIRYERLPDLCFYCGRIGHTEKECTEMKNGDKAKEREFEFGSWLKFQGFYQQAKKQEYQGNKNQNSQEDNQDSSQHMEKTKKPRAGLDVDLNQDSPIYDVPVHTINREGEEEGEINALLRMEITEEETCNDPLQIKEIRKGFGSI